jgi:hypothetical protein
MRTLTHSRTFRSALGATLLSIALASPALAGQAPSGQQSHSAYATMTFRLQLTQRMPSDATFWVAYGPLAGRFGVIRLQANGAGLYVGAKSLPRGARTTFAYVMGRGTVRTPAGPQPGGRVVTIQVMSDQTVGKAEIPLVHWQGPVG